MSNSSFQAALLSGEIDAIRTFPKSDRHNHSILGTRIERVETWIGKPLQHPPTRMSSLQEMIDYSHGVVYPYTASREGFEFTAQSAIEDAIGDGVSILEMSLDVRFISDYGASPEGFFTFIAGITESHKDRIDFRPEIGISKDRVPSDQIELARRCIQSGLFRSIDLYGNETAQPPETYRDIYAEARRHGLKLKAHVGEFGGPELIEHTLDVLEIDEIQHGVKAATSPNLMQRLRRDNIRLNICPSSNVCLGIVDEISHHPIRALVDAGVRVTVNTDDLMIFGQSVSQEYMLLYGSGLLSADELEAIRLEGLRE